MNRKLLNLMSLNRSAKRHYALTSAKAGAPDEAELYLYDVIGYDWWSDGGVTAKQFAADLRSLGDKTLHLHVNSPGGDVMDGRAMAAALAQYPGKVIAYVDGLAASAASFLIMHADEVEMTEGAFVMIHNGWTMTMGDRHEHLATAELLAKVDDSIVTDYLTRAKVDEPQLRAWMDAEKWFTAAEALEAGLIDRVAEGRKDKAEARAQARNWNLAAYDHAPAELSAPEPEPTPEPDPAIDNGHNARLRALRLAAPEPA